ncbi:MAG: phosphoglycerate kinase [Deltaproteobacteria bacterium]|jgi:phosphoglycerate kinase|nr:phosphoglycerate kinase [Deltaproteobacteria bacterium]
MLFGIRTMDELEVRGATVLLRADVNQPVDRKTGRLKDTTRIRASIPTLAELSKKGAKTVLLAHQGSDIEYKNFYTLRPHSEVIASLLDAKVKFVEDVCGPAALEAVKNLRDGEVLILENVRFLAEEQTLFELNLKLDHERQAETLLVRKLAPLADFYIGDAFAAAHRDQPSLCGFQQVLPSAMGRLFEREYAVVSQLTESPERPCVFVLGGSKIGDAFLMMETVLAAKTADLVLAGGLVGEILSWARGVDLGRTTREFIIKEGHDRLLDKAKKLLADHPGSFLVPEDYAFASDGKRAEADVGQLPDDHLLADIGSKTAGKFRQAIEGAKTVFVNGPVGIFEEAPSELGTKAVWEALAETGAHTVIGGGDSIAAAEKFRVTEKIGYVCTGGGALIRFLSGEVLPVVRALRHGSLIDEKRI